MFFQEPVVQQSSLVPLVGLEKAMVATVPTSVKEAEVGAVDRERSGPLAAEDTNRTGKKKHELQ